MALVRFESLSFAACCAAAYAAAALFEPHVFPLLQPDSVGYIEFWNSRTAIYPFFIWGLSSIGFGVKEIVYVQLILFIPALMVLLCSLLRAGIPKILIVGFVVGLSASIHFPSYHWTILTESLFFTVLAIGIAYWLDYLRTGKFIFLAAVSFCVGLLVAIRPAGIAFVPMVVLSMRLKWHRRDASSTLICAAVIVSLSLGPAIERGISHFVHGKKSSSILPETMMGKAAMLLREETVYTGIHARDLSELGSALYRTYEPVRQFLARLPSLSALPIETGAYEVVAQYQILNDEITAMSSKTGVPADVYRIELGKQAILQNAGGFLNLSITHYLGQWSIMALSFPPTSRAVNAFVQSYSIVPLADKVGDLYLHPPSSPIAMVVYPTFLIAGGLTFFLGFTLTYFLIWPRVGDAGSGFYLMAAAFFAASVHLYTFLISLMNVATPRYLVAVYPQILLAGIFLYLGASRSLLTKPQPDCCA